MGAFTAKFSTTPSGKTIDRTQKCLELKWWHGQLLSPCKIWWKSRDTRRRERLKCDVFLFLYYRQDLPQAPLPVLFLLMGRFWGFSPSRDDTLHWSRWNLAWRSGPTVPSSLPNLTWIGSTCRPCRAKNQKIGPWVKAIPAELPAADPAGNK